MVKVTVGEHCYYLDGYLKSNLDTVKKDVKLDYDSFIIITGREGYGKSTLAGQVALYLDPTYNLDRCCFNDEQFKDAVDNAKKYEAIVFDETMGYLSSRGAMSKFNRSLIKVMSEMRNKNLFVILCISNFFELDRYPAVHRSTGLIHIYKRSRFGSYDYNKKRNLYIKGKKVYAYVVPPTFIAKFTKYFPLNWDDYNKKKAEAIREWEDNRGREKKLQQQRDLLIIECYNKGLLDIERLSDLIGLSTRHIRRILA